MSHPLDVTILGQQQRLHPWVTILDYAPRAAIPWHPDGMWPTEDQILSRPRILEGQGWYHQAAPDEFQTEPGEAPWERFSVTRHGAIYIGRGTDSDIFAFPLISSQHQHVWALQDGPLLPLFLHVRPSTETAGMFHLWEVTDIRTEWIQGSQPELQFTGNVVDLYMIITRLLVRQLVNYGYEGSVINNVLCMEYE